ncbi:glycosyltransferase family 2 protein [Niabella hibiscisoli]|uniref:glycosyltransferase family 2 protein n=1 Tax=Niabella hibiscisoli TaxID=1825928 RepID=UPI001F0DDAA4|nr:glycosyltransferase family 2 protein [Niabella hibiscisoli]MCH5719955.1 glycosyltransferase family 2 protein [Niabella hibiscisoli]
MVTVIIPSFNRAHLLRRTVPTYLQQGVSKIIIVDDASTDNTEQVVQSLAKEIKEIEYIKLAKNSKQTVAKNTGIDHTRTEWIYFGDDDSVLLPGSIPALLATCEQYKADICGAKAMYMTHDEDITSFVKNNTLLLPPRAPLVDINELKTYFHYDVTDPRPVLFTHASALVKTTIAKEVRFDERFVGNCYREETDFFVRCSIKGAVVFYDSKAVQVNLPRGIATGGSHSARKYKWYYYSFVNNHYFLTKNWAKIRAINGEAKSRIIVEAIFLKNLLLSGFKNLTRRWLKN